MVMLPLGALPIKDVQDIGPPPYVEPAASFACGEYLADVFDCAFCHGDDLAGGPRGLLPVGPNLAGAKVWTTEQFISTMRTGETPYRKMLSEDMPWEGLGKMDDLMLEAALPYVKQLAP
jgi:mono/diheme cytochrome c family protein